MTTTGSADIHYATAAVNGIELHYAHAGAGPLIVFLHGFPQFHYAFRDQLRAFSADHLAIAPDQRGYNRSSKPEGAHSYGTGAASWHGDLRSSIRRCCGH